VAAVERRHFWFAARNDVILSALRHTVGPLGGRRVLDVGCGTGFVLAALERAGLDTCGIDMHRAALLLARPRVVGPLVRSAAATLPFFPDFDLVTLLDVLEHVDDDAALLRQAADTLTPGGHVVVTVPAGPHLWTTYDEVIGHKRRYDRVMLAAVLERAALDVRHISYFSGLPMVAQMAHRWLTAAPSAAAPDTIAIVRRALQVPPEPLNTLFRLSIQAEGPFRRLAWMRGGSLLAIARPRR
jgi:SAM-dependent methyltransferase